MNTREDTFREKCRENLEVTEWAQGHGHCNAAASRYYYALRHAAEVFLELERVEAPKFETIQGRLVPQWSNRRLIDEVRCRVERGELIEEVWDLRIKGDYWPISVEDHELPQLRKRADPLFSALRCEVGDD